MIRKTAYAALAGLAAFLPALAGAQSVGAPTDWQLDLQAAGSPVMEGIASFHSQLLYIIVAIALFVTALLGYVFVRFNAKANPNPTRTAHNTVLEVAWTVIPILILVYIAIPSFKLLYKEGRIPEAGMTLKITGHQWFWSYTYPDQGGFTFDSLIKCRTAEECAGAAGADGQAPIRLLDVDNPVVVPVGTVVRLQLVSDDVIHSWAMPSLGVKTDAVPGRLQETWFEVTKEGRYYGQCSELCGVDHGYMPIMVQAVSKEAFDAWTKEAQTKFAHDDSLAPAHEVAQVQAR